MMTRSQYKHKYNWKHIITLHFQKYDPYLQYQESRLGNHASGRYGSWQFYSAMDLVQSLPLLYMDIDQDGQPEFVVKEVRSIKICPIIERGGNFLSPLFVLSVTCDVLQSFMWVSHRSFLFQNATSLFGWKPKKRIGLKTISWFHNLFLIPESFFMASAENESWLKKILNLFLQVC